MKHRLTGAILLLYPRRVRERHGQEIVGLIDDLAAHDEHSPIRLFIRLAMDGLVQRLASTATAWAIAAVLVATAFAPLAVSDLATARALHVVRRTQRTIAPARPTQEAPHPRRQPHRPSRPRLRLRLRTAPGNRASRT